MSFRIIRDDITRVMADAIVNSANPDPRYAGLVDASIYAAAGAERLLAERKKIGNIPVGGAAATPAFALNAKHIIHVVAPKWVDGTHGEREAVRSCYDGALNLAKRLGCESVAFPLIATGAYGFPKDEALKIAVAAFEDFLSKNFLSADENEMEIIMVVFDDESFVLSGGIFSEVEEYVDANYVHETLANAAPRSPGEGRFEGRTGFLGGIAERSYDSLDDLMGHVAETWQEILLKTIDEKGYSDIEVYKRANVDRKLFSKIRSNQAYQPKKITAVAFALALRLDLDETRDFLARAGYALSPSSRFDLIIEYFIKKRVYDSYTINLALFEHDQPLIGG